MSYRFLRGPSLGGSYALIHLLASAALLYVTWKPTTVSLPPPSLLQGMPLLGLLGVIDQAAGKPSVHWPPEAVACVVAGVLVLNSYLWGYALAATQRLLLRKFTRRTAPAPQLSGSQGNQM